MVTNLQREGVREATVKTLLGGGEYEKTQQKAITRELGKFLRETARMSGMSAE